MSDHSSGLWKLALIPVATFALGFMLGAGLAAGALL